ncbi:hypothetical protein N431DRAFT_472534 [Stipitochalara longipes BDJ]|nr:hypothetical protein N431DRAFT_472534 [Stipitochalara longipes BDJ]
MTPFPTGARYLDHEFDLLAIQLALGGLTAGMELSSASGALRIVLGQHVTSTVDPATRGNDLALEPGSRGPDTLQKWHYDRSKQEQEQEQQQQQQQQQHEQDRFRVGPRHAQHP